MKTIADFKRKMTIGAKVKSKLFYKKGDAWDLKQEREEREVSVIQSNSFALKTYQPGKDTWSHSWCAWPKRDQFTALDNNTAQITDGDTRLIYQFTN